MMAELGHATVWRRECNKEFHERKSGETRVPPPSDAMPNQRHAMTMISTR
jgi:hypothetical protein